ncbi:MAG: hypothetical protein HC916_18780 [Coleofasciculaceae cyanobacterium SM2_1_6]|nr:hypothetical protein [Coleofasciculaceae cyanobacterium SM2_1_6]
MSSKAIATLVQIMESLPENIQIQVVEHLQEYIQQSNITADTSVPQKVANFDWDEWEQRVESANPDPDELTTEEICEIVREVSSGGLEVE